MKKNALVVISSLLSLFPSILILISKNRVLEIPSWNETIFSDVGIVNTINELRGEEVSPILGKILYNKSFYLLVFIQNASRLLDPIYLSKYILVVSIIPFFVGLYLVICKKFVSSKLILFWLLVITSIVGFMKDPEQWLIFFIPLFGILIYLGQKRINSKLLDFAIIVNFLISFLTFTLP